MPEQTIRCPKCDFEFQVTEAIAHQIEGKLRSDYEAAARAKQQEFDRAFEGKNKEIQAAIAKERERVEAEARSRAMDAVSVQMKDLQEQVTERARQLEESRQQELALRKRQRELEEQQKGIEVELARKLEEGRQGIWEQATAKLTEESQLKLREKELQLEQMRSQIADLKKRAEQGPQERQGEVLELAFEDNLRSAFRFDEIEPVKKGQKGGDVLQHVLTPSGVFAGAILWELKRTKTWAGGWVPKLKDDQRAAKAELAVIVSEALPADVKAIGNVEGVWVSDFPSAMGLALALRQNLIALADARSALVGQQGKMELLYEYLSGAQFRHRVEGIVESFTSMKKDLDAERRVMEKHWSKREKQIEIVVRNTAGMYGDLQGLIGGALQTVQALELQESEEQEPAKLETGE